MWRNVKHLTSIIELGLGLVELNRNIPFGFQQESSLSHLEPDIASHFLIERKTELKLNEVYGHDSPFTKENYGHLILKGLLTLLI